MKSFRKKIIKHNQSLTFLFYDFETFGKNPYLDNPAQFSCIRTDKDFNIISCSEEFFCRPSFDYLPDPEAMLITGISPIYAKNYGLNEFYFAKKIYSFFMQSNTCIIGYNNIYFDDEFTRNIFYRNFFDPYEWSWKNGNSRWDILDVLRACYVLRPKGIHWPINDNNRVSFKLTDISSANNIVHEHAHSATSDVYATIQIAKLLKLKQPRLFNFFFKYRTKVALLSLINVNNINPIIYISRFFSANNNSISWIVPILWHPFNRNLLLCIDLSKNVQILLNFFNKKADTIIDFKQLYLMGIQCVYINRCPILVPINSITVQDSIRLKINITVCYDNLRVLRNNLFIINQLKRLLIHQYKFTNSNVTDDSIELHIYNAFFSFSDKNLINYINKSLPKRIIINDFLKYDRRIQKLLTYCVARNFPGMLYSDEKKIWEERCRQIYNKKNIQKNAVKIDELLQVNKNNYKNVLLLKELRNYVDKCILRFNNKNFF